MRATNFRLLRCLARFFTSDRLAVGISLLGVLASYLVASRVFESMPHIEDEAAYVWQARVIALGHLTIPTPPHAASYLVPFVVDFNGQRFGKYPPGWPGLLAAAIKLGGRAWLNPLLAGLGVWLTYRLGKRFFSEKVGLLAAGLTITSPFFLMNSGSLLSHPLGLVLSAGFALAWLELFDPPAGGCPKRRAKLVSLTTSGVFRTASPLRVAVTRLRFLSWDTPLLVLLAGGSLGLLVITRPFTALAVALPFGLHGVILLARGSQAVLPIDRAVLPTDRAVAPSNRAVARYVLAIGLIALAFTGLYFGWQKIVTGDAMKNPYLLWWPYDKIGFGKGHGVLAQGHDLQQAFFNTQGSFVSGAYDLFGWWVLSWIFIPFGLWAVTIGKLTADRRRGPRNRQAWMLFGMFTSLVLLYMAYWIGSELYGPRYYYEGLFSLTLLSGAGIASLAGWRVNPLEDGGENVGNWGVMDHAGADAESSDHEGLDRGNHIGLPLREGTEVGDHIGLPLGEGTEVGNHIGLPLREGTEVGDHIGSPLQAGTEVGDHAGSPLREWMRRWRGLAIMLLVVGLVGYNLAVYLPGRLKGMHGLYGINRGVLRDFLNARVFPENGEVPAEAGVIKPALIAAIKPALIIVHSDKWLFYGALLELEDPYLTTPYVFAWSMDPATDAALANDFPGRLVFHYYQDEPGVLYQHPKE